MTQITPEPDAQCSDFDPLQVAELIEACRAHTASLEDVATTISQALHELFEYETDDPHLGVCIDTVRQLLDAVVRQLLDRVLVAFPPLGVVTHDADPADRANDIAVGCEAQRERLLRARHITLATMFILRNTDIEQCFLVRETAESLRDLEAGLRQVFDGLNPATLGLPTPPPEVRHVCSSVHTH